MDTLTVVDNPSESRFEARADDGAVVGYVSYDGQAGGPGVVVVIHTIVEPAFEGQGVGGRLVRGTLDLIRASGRTVVPLCPFVSAYLRRHPDYQDLVAPDSEQR
ncbi:GNAT family N-acetyltransferase [Pengzhenrongella sicca]|uniref:N-acetyltransferase n=1 Tax=Pengzhenrongella sicca TaxID=2819238 RepID=A0A8A4ZGD2_9MICO|nr:GNAT family N-acetyltransferase [Pengzhenrongella sicca]QTE29586.1 N-acetyltransferase [Pengzhenrongella sicca]